MPHKLLILNGPNLNLLGQRQPEIYGHETLADIEAACAVCAKDLGVKVDFKQSNHEGQLVDWIQQAHGVYSGLLVNAGAYTHTSIAIMDALLAAALPCVEVHLSNIHRREEFRSNSFVAKASHGMVAGFGLQSYVLGLQALVHILGK